MTPRQWLRDEAAHDTTEGDCAQLVIDALARLRAENRKLLAKLREVEALTGELTLEVWERLSRAQGYIRCNENFCITPRDAALTPKHPRKTR